MNVVGRGRGRVQSEIAFVIAALKRLDRCAFQHDFIPDSIENYRFFVSAVSHLHRRTLVTHAAPVALRVIKPRSCATTIANKQFLLHQASLTGIKQLARDHAGQMRTSFSISRAEFAEPSIAIWLLCELLAE
jgi:hypothetical protein